MRVAVVMVGMVAMLIVVMVVLVAMAMRGMIMVTVAMAVMIVTMVMMVVTVMRMVVVPVRVASIRIRPAFWIERRLDLDHARAEPLHHLLDHVIAADAQGLRHDLGRQMAVAEMPADANEVVRIAAADLEQRLGRRDHLDQAAVLQHQRIPAA
ncbi:hypothetical protein ASG57_32895 [Bradyrhizobium sp. Leaf396]|nr:hypothetical protein ASG57_32895 [Bradyrhizobium sp. Leaf396]